MATIIDGVLDWQLDLLDHTQLHTITVYTLYNSQQLSFFSCSENPGSNCCSQLLWHPLHYSLTAAAPLSNTKLAWLTEDSSYIASGPDPKENAYIVVLAVVCWVFIRPLLSNGCLTSVSTVDLLTRTVA
jgi:hypothetical protein